MAFKCPHCGLSGISFPDKLITSAAVWHHRPATCKHCRKPARLSGRVVQLQFFLFIIALAIFSWVVAAQYRVTAALIIAVFIVSIGILAPLKKQLI